ncbi:hypothetical protein O181_132284 [Austropuccinia psidii MF-1]|uniref:Uncharacterized protein n=1 Tax=Austropuccinia psidii MF-1 TaxID=1389203 RepID=A0A9Q3L731_9BASI|nr:hypothetical protein [Austropuccinia psidii MF-1]
MVHTRNESNYPVRPDGCGQRRGNTKSRSGRSSSRKTHLEDSRFSPHFPRSAPTKFLVNSESELIHVNISRAEPFSSGRNKNLSMPIQELVQRSQRGGVGNMPKPLEGGNELLLTHPELSGSGEYHRALSRSKPIVFQKLDQKKELEMPPALEKEGPVASTRFKPAPEFSKDKLKGPQKKNRGCKNHQGKGKGKANWHRPYPQVYRMPKWKPYVVDNVFNMARTLMEFTAKEKVSG